MSHIYISYSHKDIKFADRIAKAIEKNGINVWIDRENMVPAASWTQQIYQAIENAEAFFFLISPDSIKSRLLQNEISHAVNNNKRIISILIRDIHHEVLPPEIAHTQWISCQDGVDDFESAIGLMIRAMYTDYKWLQFHTELQRKALDWKRNNQDNSWLLRGKQLQQAEVMLVRRYVNPQPTDLQRQFVSHSRKAEGPIIPKRNLKVFLCHSSFDKPRVRKLYKRLSNAGFDVWLDEIKLTGGQDWETEIKKAVKTSHVVLVCLSKSSISKVGFIQKEIRYALDIAQEHPDEDIYIIPLRLENCNVPDRLSRWQWIDFYKPQGYEKLVKALEAREYQVRSRMDHE
jgi:glutaredoxin-related protein